MSHRSPAISFCIALKFLLNLLEGAGLFVMRLDLLRESAEFPAERLEVLVHRLPEGADLPAARLALLVRRLLPEILRESADLLATGLACGGDCGHRVRPEGGDLLPDSSELPLDSGELPAGLGVPVREAVFETGEPGADLVETPLQRGDPRLLPLDDPGKRAQFFQPRLPFFDLRAQSVHLHPDGEDLAPGRRRLGIPRRGRRGRRGRGGEGRAVPASPPSGSRPGRRCRRRPGRTGGSVPAARERGRADCCPP